MCRVRVAVAGGGGQLLAPIGCATPHRVPLAFDVEGGAWHLTGDVASGQLAALITPDSDTGDVVLHYRFADGAVPYPQAMFHANDSRYTRAADTLTEEAAAVAAHAGGGEAGLLAVVQDVAAKFTYGHPEERFYDEADHIPQLCSLTTGSCVDINLYLIAALRAAGYEAGYMTGYFFPREKQGHSCDDMHCWVVSRHAGTLHEWDIAHHMKMGRSPIAPGLNPRGGHRVPMAHSMGLNFPECGLHDLKLLGEPIRVVNGTWDTCAVTITCEGGMA